MFNNINPRTKRQIIISVALGLLVIIVWFVIYSLMHGRIVIHSDTVSNVVLYQTSSVSAEELGPKTEFEVSPGDYVVRVDLADKTSYQKSITAKAFDTVHIYPKSKSLKIEHIQEYSGDNIIPIGDDRYMSYSGQIDDWYTPYVEDLPFVDMPLDTVLATNLTESGDVIIFGTRVTEGTMFFQAGLYKPADNTFRYISEGIDINSSYAAISRLSGAVSLCLNDRILTISENGIKETKLPSKSTAQNDSAPIMDISDKTIVALIGSNFISDLTDVESVDLKEAALNIYSTDLKLKSKIDLGKRADIFSVSLSPDNKKVAVVSSLAVGIYDLETKEKLYEATSNTPIGDSMLWQDSNSFIFEGDSSMIYRSNIKEKESYGIIKTDQLNITNLTTIHKCYLYLTGFKPSWGTDRTVPDGYRIRICDKV